MVVRRGPSFSRSLSLTPLRSSPSKIDSIVDSISTLTLLEAAELVTALKVRHTPSTGHRHRRREAREGGRPSSFLRPRMHTTDRSPALVFNGTRAHRRS